MTSASHRLSDLIIEPVVRAALLEDLGHAGDITSRATVPEDAMASAFLRARQNGTVAGLHAARLAFGLVDKALNFKAIADDGARVKAGDTIAEISGAARSLLSAERVALNFLGHLSGVATATAALVDEVANNAPGAKARITCTRKTTPGLRALEKQAVLLGGGVNHRFGLGDAILIKDNHIVAAGGAGNRSGVTAALKAAQAFAGHMVQIEIEVDTLAQLEEALAEGAKTVLLDNMSTDDLKAAVKLNAGRAVLEASGNVRLETVAAIAATGVDYISSGAITHSAPSLDVGLDFKS